MFKECDTMDDKSVQTKPTGSLQKTLAENHIALQRKNIDLIQSVHNLTTKIDKLIGIFEEASKHVLEVGEDKKILELTDKLEELLEQNRNISKGLTILEGYVKSKVQFEGARQF